MYYVDLESPKYDPETSEWSFAIYNSENETLVRYADPSPDKKTAHANARLLVDNLRAAMARGIPVEA